MVYTSAELETKFQKWLQTSEVNRRPSDMTEALYDDVRNAFMGGCMSVATLDTTRTISAIANEIIAVWINPIAAVPNTTGKSRPYGCALPYLRAMREMETLSDNFLNDSGMSVVLYFLANASRWSGPDARRIKAELNAMVKAYAKKA